VRTELISSIHVSRCTLCAEHATIRTSGEKAAKIMWKFQQSSPKHDILWIPFSNCQILSGNVLYVLIIFKDPISDALRSARNRFNSNKAQLKDTNSCRTLPLLKISQCLLIFHDKWVPVARAWRVLRLRMEERPPIWRVAANILNKQSRTETRGGPPVWGLG
jgi:hypothetical protein